MTKKRKNRQPEQAVDREPAPSPRKDFAELAKPQGPPLLNDIAGGDVPEPEDPVRDGIAMDEAALDEIKRVQEKLDQTEILKMPKITDTMGLLQAIYAMLWAIDMDIIAYGESVMTDLRTRCSKQSVLARRRARDLWPLELSEEPPEADSPAVPDALS